MEKEKKVGAKATTEITRATEVTENKSNYEELSKTDKELQSYVDRRVSDALKTAKAKWQEDLEAKKLAKMKSDKKLQYQLEKEKSEKDNALAELNAYRLKEEAIKIASEKGLEVSLLDLIDFKTVTSEKLNKNIDNLSTVFNKAVEKTFNERLKEYTPITKTSSTIENKKRVNTLYKWRNTMEVSFKCEIKGLDKLEKKINTIAKELPKKVEESLEDILKNNSGM